MSADTHLPNIGRMHSMRGFMQGRSLEIGNVFLNGLGLSHKIESLFPSPLTGIALETAVGGLIAPMKELKVTKVLEMRPGLFNWGGGK